MATSSIMHGFSIKTNEEAEQFDKAFSCLLSKTKKRDLTGFNSASQDAIELKSNNPKR